MATREERYSGPYIPLTSDLVFKYVFGGEHSTHCLRSLLSAIQEDAGYPPVASVRIANPFNLQDTDGTKLSVVDVRATDVDGVVFTVEAQSMNHHAFAARVLYYWAKAYGAQLREGDFYTALNPVVSMNILDFRLFPEKTNAPLHTTFVPGCIQKPTLPPLRDFAIHFLELSKYDRDIDYPSTALNRWLYFIINRGRREAMEDPVMKQILQESPEIAEADRRYEEFVADEQLRSRLDARDKFIRTHAQLIHEAEQKGLERGREQGLEQARDEARQQQRETARTMKRDGLDLNDIVRYTGLSEEEIRGL